MALTLFQALDRDYRPQVTRLIATAEVIPERTLVADSYGHQGAGYHGVLSSVIKKGWWDLVEPLLAKGVDIQGVNGFHGSPLIAAVDQRNPTVVRQLLLAGADPNFVDRQGHTALLRSVIVGDPAIAHNFRWATLWSLIEPLLEAGADLHATGNYGGFMWHALGRVPSEDMPAMCAELIDRGLNVDARTPNGTTPFMIAARQADPVVLRTLIRAGVDHNAVNNDGTTAQAIYDKQTLDHKLKRPPWPEVIGPILAEWAADQLSRQLSEQLSGQDTQDTGRRPRL